MAIPTPQQSRVLDFIRHFLRDRGFPPTHAEIALGLGFRSPNAAAQHVRLLAKKGLLEVSEGRSRGIRFPESGSSAEPVRGLPVIGRVAAGAPILAEPHVESHVDVDPSLFHPRADYLLRVRGDSMIDAGIFSGDLVAVHRTPQVEPGSMAVVRLDDEVTVKHWRPRADGTIALEPRNDAYQPIIVDPSMTSISIEGAVVGLLRLGLATTLR